MKHLKIMAVILALTVGALVACSETEEPAVSQSEQQPTQPGDTAQQQPPASDTAQQQPPASDTAQQQPPAGETAQQQSQPGDTAQQTPSQDMSNQQTTGQQSGGMAQQQEPGAAAGDQVEVAGTIEQTSDGMVIKSPDESYNLTGQDLSQMVGKDVRVKGSLREINGKQTIEVSEVDIIG